MFFFFFFFDELKEALRSNKSFMDLLRRDAQTGRSKRKKATDAVKEPFHPEVDTLHDYVLGSLPNEQMRQVMDHVAVCRECARASLEIRRLDKEITKDFRHYMRTSVSEPKDPSSDDLV